MSHAVSWTDSAREARPRSEHAVEQLVLGEAGEIPPVRATTSP